MYIELCNVCVYPIYSPQCLSHSWQHDVYWFRLCSVRLKSATVTPLIASSLLIVHLLKMCLDPLQQVQLSPSHSGSRKLPETQSLSLMQHALLKCSHHCRIYGILKLQVTLLSCHNWSFVKGMQDGTTFLIGTEVSRE